MGALLVEPRQFNEIINGKKLNGFVWLINSTISNCFFPNSDAFL